MYIWYTIYIYIYIYDRYEAEIISLFVIDLNECGEDNGGCNQLCTNQGGYHQCHCLFGFTLNSDGRICDGKMIYQLQFYMFIPVNKNTIGGL